MEKTSRQPDSRILSAVFSAMDEVNELLPTEHQLLKSPDAPILGPTAVLDSMAFINLVAALEERLAAELGITVSLTGPEDRTGAFRTVRTLVTYISQVVGASAEQPIA